jgi:methionine-rich copper-binding protein CopC
MRKSQMIRTASRTFATVALAYVGLATAAQAHARLDGASPAVGSTVASSPGQVTLRFTEGLEAKFSGAQVQNGAGARVDTGSSVSGSTIRVGVKNLGPGVYTVQWHALSVDTHKTQGSFSFHVGK